MKWIAFLLLLANLFFLAFSIVTRPVDETSQEKTGVGEQAGVRPLQRLAELPVGTARPRVTLDPSALPTGIETQSEAPKAPVLPAPVHVDESTTCYIVGGFADERAATVTGANLEAAGMSVEAPRSEQVERVRYWVLLPPFRSEKQAQDVIERLKRAGIGDYYLIPNGENKNALSLGVFSTREAAQRRVDDVTELKLKIRVEEVSFPLRRYVVDARLMGGSPPDWQQLLPPGVEVEARACAIPRDLHSAP